MIAHRRFVITLVVFTTLGIGRVSSAYAESSKLTVLEKGQLRRFKRGFKLRFERRKSELIALVDDGDGKWTQSERAFARKRCAKWREAKVGDNVVWESITTYELKTMNAAQAEDYRRRNASKQSTTKSQPETGVPKYWEFNCATYFVKRDGPQHRVILTLRRLLDDRCFEAEGWGRFKVEFENSGHFLPLKMKSTYYRYKPETIELYKKWKEVPDSVPSLVPQDGVIGNRAWRAMGKSVPIEFTTTRYGTLDQIWYPIGYNGLPNGERRDGINPGTDHLGEGGIYLTRDKAGNWSASIEHKRNQNRDGSAPASSEYQTKNHVPMIPCEMADAARTAKIAAGKKSGDCNADKGGGA